MNICDTLIHLNETLDTATMTALETQLQNMPGVVASRFNPTKVHLLSIAYDPSRIQATALLKQVHERGYQAQLVGL